MSWKLILSVGTMVIVLIALFSLKNGKQSLNNQAMNPSPTSLEQAQKEEVFPNQPKSLTAQNADQTLSQTDKAVDDTIKQVDQDLQSLDQANQTGDKTDNNNL